MFFIRKFPGCNAGSQAITLSITHILAQLQVLSQNQNLTE